jgi:hypothetical protein
MSNIPDRTQAVHPDYPTHDDEGTVIRYDDDPDGWLQEPDYGARKVSPYHERFGRESAAQEFLDDDTDFRDGPQQPPYDVVFERPLIPGKPVELIVLDGGHPLSIGVFKTLDMANDVAFRCAFFRFALKSVV